MMRFKQKFAYVAILSLFAAPLQAYAVDAFKVGDTQIKLGGYVDLDYHQTHTSEGHIDGESIARDFYIPSVIPTGSGDGEGWDTADLTAQSSRFNVGFSREINGKRAIGFLELDFLGVGSNERVVNAHAPRLRRAYIKYAGWLLGQEWTTFQNLSAIPESASFLVLSDGMVFNRQAQIRFSTAKVGYGNFDFAIENSGRSRFYDAGGVTQEIDSAERPDIIARYNLSGKDGNISLAVIARQIDAAGPDEDTFGVNFAGRLNLGRNDVRFTLFHGEGLGRYVGLHAAAEGVLTQDDKVRAVESTGGYVAFRVPTSSTGRFNFGAAHLDVNNDSSLPGYDGGRLDTVSSYYVAYLWDIGPKLTYGVEFMQGERQNEDGAEGDISRATFSAKYTF